MTSEPMKSTNETTTRRAFMQSTGAAVIGAAIATQSALPKARAADNDVLRVGLIGCGGRGSGAARQALSADRNTKLVALGDAFEDRLDACLTKLKDSDIGAQVDVDPEHRFTGFDAYKGVIEASDVVLLATPPGFRPQHVRAAVDAGKHLFVEKPIAVDGPGVRAVLEACKVAETKNICVVTGLCYRYHFAKQDTMKRVHGGDIGDILTLQATYNTGALWHRGRKSDWSETEYQMRNWLYFNWLSGDHINEQHIHSLDKLAWAMQDEYPVKVSSSGGRVQRTDPKYGNIYDHFNSVYEWENGVRGFSSCRQWSDAATDVSDYAFGAKGTAHLQTHRIEKRNGKVWQHEEQGPDDMYQNEHNALFAAIRKGKPINDGHIMCNSTLMAIMARMSAYTGQTITRDQALHSKEDLAPPAYAWGDIETPPVPQPGLTKFA